MTSSPSEARALDEDLNGLAFTIKQVIDVNLSDPAMRRRASRLKGSLVVREPAADVATTVTFARGEVAVGNGAIPRPSAFLEAGFEELAAISSGQLSPIWAVLTLKVKARGNLFFLLSVSPLLVYRQ